MLFINRYVINIFILLLSVVASIHSRAGEFIVEDGRNVTNGGNALSENDVLIVGSQGSIRVSDPFMEAVNANSDFLTVINRGVIETTGEFASAIAANSEGFVFRNFGLLRTTGVASGGLFSLKPNALIQNLGTVETEEVGADAISVSGDTSVVENSGAIVTRADIAAGMLVQSEGNRLQNSGSITTFGKNSNAIFVDSHRNTIHNSGTIRVSEQFSRGIYLVGNENQVFSSGLIAGSGVDAETVLVAGDSNTFTNSGTITAAGSGSAAVTVLGNNNVVSNSGTVISAFSHSIGFQGTGNVLRLSGPALLGGLVILGNGTSVEVNTTRSHSVLWDFSFGVLNGPVAASGAMPHFYNPATRQFAIFDSSSLIRSTDALGDMTGLLFETLHGGLAAARTEPAPGSGFWAHGFGGVREHGATAFANAADFDLSGFALGYSWEIAGGAGLSVMAGYLASGLDISASPNAAVPGLLSSQTQSRGWFAGFGGSREVAGFVIDAGVIAGVLSHQSVRFVNDNLAARGTSFVNASFDSWFVSPEIGISTNIEVGQDLVLTPATRLRFAAQSYGAYGENGPSQGRAMFAQHTVSIIESVSELGLTWNAGFGSVTAQAGLLARSSVGPNTVAASMLGASRQVGFGGDSATFFIGAGADIDLGPDARLSFAGKTYPGGDFRGHEGSVSLTIRF